MSDEWIDVTAPITSDLVVWPGDPAVAVDPTTDEHGWTVRRLVLGSHTGTHMDAPRHLFPDGATLDALPLDVVIGPARVVAVEGDRVTAVALDAHDLRPGERVLLRTRNSDRPWWRPPFDERFVALTPDAARHVAERGVRLLGVDHLSVSGFHDDGAAVHGPLLAGGVWILEGLDLTRVAPGAYDLVALPLAIAGADGAPTRAALRARKG